MLQGFRQTLKNLSKINDSSVAPVPDIHVERPGQCEKQPPTIENPWENSYPAIVIPCRPQFSPRPLQGFPKTFKFLRKFNDPRSRSRPAAANSEFARLKHIAKSPENPKENTLFTHGRVRITTQTRRVGRAVGTSQKKKGTAQMQYNTLAELPLGMLYVGDTSKACRPPEGTGRIRHILL